MKLFRMFGTVAAAGFVACFLPIWSAVPADAGSCAGKVRGLSGNYNQKRGTGFLAVRTGPSSGSRKIDELFNGDVVGLYARKGSWYEVDTPSGKLGWAHKRWIRTSCDPNNP